MRVLFGIQKNPQRRFKHLANILNLSNTKGKDKRYVDLYSALDDNKYLVLKAPRHGSHSLTCK